MSQKFSLDFVVEPGRHTTDSVPTDPHHVTQHTRIKRKGDTKEGPARMSKKKKGSNNWCQLIKLIDLFDPHGIKKMYGKV